MHTPGTPAINDIPIFSTFKHKHTPVNLAVRFTKTSAIGPLKDELIDPKIGCGCFSILFTIIVENTV